jgi:hypothetical protein
MVLTLGYSCNLNDAVSSKLQKTRPETSRDNCLKITIISILSFVVRDDPKLLHDGGEIPKSQGRGWWFDSQL